jgi:hypothetical protein
MGSYQGKHASVVCTLACFPSQVADGLSVELQVAEPSMAPQRSQHPPRGFASAAAQDAGSFDPLAMLADAILALDGDLDMEDAVGSAQPQYQGARLGKRGREVDDPHYNQLGFAGGSSRGVKRERFDESYNGPTGGYDDAEDGGDSAELTRPIMAPGAPRKERLAAAQRYLGRLLEEDAALFAEAVRNVCAQVSGGLYCCCSRMDRCLRISLGLPYVAACGMSAGHASSMFCFPCCYH